MKKSQSSRFRSRNLFQPFFVALAVSLSLSASPLLVAAAPQRGSLEQLQARLKSPIATASIKTLEKAMKAAVAANPAGAADYVEAFIKSGRKESCEDLGKMVAAAIAALGKNPPAHLVAAIVERSVLLLPQCAPTIVAAAVKAAPASLADEIVEIAIASVANPEQMVGNVTMGEAILAAALGARPGLDAALLASAANSGLARNLSRILAIAMPSAQGSQAQGELNGVAAYQKNPNLAAFLAAERARDQEPAASPVDPPQ